ncbi:MAG: hypothetical protein ISQ53_07840 [Synechococcus sp. BS307-5m-G39]|nr:hypothetical protein [Synechococcus sp. BS307-5m-G39]
MRGPRIWASAEVPPKAMPSPTPIANKPLLAMDAGGSGGGDNSCFLRVLVASSGVACEQRHHDRDAISPLN